MGGQRQPWPGLSQLHSQTPESGKPSHQSCCRLRRPPLGRLRSSGAGMGRQEACWGGRSPSLWMNHATNLPLTLSRDQRRLLTKRAPGREVQPHSTPAGLTLIGAWGYGTSGKPGVSLGSESGRCQGWTPGSATCRHRATPCKALSLVFRIWEETCPGWASRTLWGLELGLTKTQGR